MGDRLELDARLADALRADARERGFADGEAYLRWLVHNRERLFERAMLDDRLREMERRLDGIETTLADESSGGTDFWADDEVTAVIDSALE
ncbi:MAG: hypothetical protein V5A34_06575 [Halapricum sp.]|jgi:hypothetical protein